MYWRETNIGGWLIVLSLFLAAGRIAGYIDLSWWWVTAPIWIPLALYVTLLIGLLVFGFGCFAIGGILMLLERSKR